MLAHRSARFCSVLAAFVLFSVSRVAALEPYAGNSVCIGGESIQNLPDTLLIIADGFNANYNRIRTWRGTFLLTEHTTRTTEELSRMKVPEREGPDSNSQTMAKVVRRFRGEFACDFVGCRLFTAKSISEPPTISVGGGDSQPAGPDTFAIRAVSTPDLYIHMDPDRQHGMFMGLEDWRVTNGRAAFRDPTQLAENGDWGNLTSPQKFFWIQGNMMHYGDYLRDWGKKLMSPKTTQDVKKLFSGKRTVEDVGTKYCLNIASHQEFIIDSALGYNVLRMRQYQPESKALVSDRQVGYRSQDDVFVPESVRLQVYSQEGTTLVFDYEWSLEESEINVPLDDSVFGYKQLGLVDGERVVDRVDNIGYIFNRGELTEPKKFDIAVSKLDSSEPIDNVDPSRYGMLVYLNAAILAILLGYYIIRRTFSRKSSPREP